MYSETYNKFDRFSTKEIFMMSKQYRDMSIDDKWFSLKNEREILLDILVRRYRTCKIGEEKELIDACYLIVKPIEKYWRYKQTLTKAQYVFGLAFEQVLDDVVSSAFIYTFNKYCTMKPYHHVEIQNVDLDGSGDWIRSNDQKTKKAVFTSLFWMNLDNYMRANIKLYNSERKKKNTEHVNIEHVEYGIYSHSKQNFSAWTTSSFKSEEEVLKTCIMMIKKEKERRFLEMALEFGGDVKSEVLKEEFLKDFPMSKQQYQKFRDKVVGMVKAEFYNQRSQ